MERVEQPAAADGAEARQRDLSCPWCGSERVERVGVVGSHLMVAQYICLDCRSPFESIRR